ncbi:hypothetical protein I552_0512 [Mycobacterium xenopi 3993]|nr:hypothetical protein I552_0512 [Mycobacterium xenopi 3993]
MGSPRHKWRGLRPRIRSKGVFGELLEEHLHPGGQPVGAPSA